MPISASTWRRCYAFRKGMTLRRPTSHTLAAILLVAIILRFAVLDLQSVWLDEAASVRNATPVLERVDPNHPPLYFMYLQATMEAIGRSEAAIRLPSAVFSVLSVGLLYLLGRKVASRETALLAAALLALSPLDVWYGREARMYAAIAFVTLLMALGLGWRHWAGFVLFFAALSVGLYLSYLTPPIWLALSAVWLIFWRREDGRLLHVALWLTASAGAWLLYRPWWPEITRWAEGALLRHWMFERVRAVLGMDALSPLHFAGAAVAVAAALVGAAAIAPALLARRRWRRVITALFIVGFVGVVLLAPVPRVYAVKRVLVTGWALVILFVAWLAMQLKARRRLVVTLLLGVSLASSLVSTFLVPKDDWRGVAQAVQREAPEVGVWLDPGWNNIVYGYYDAEREVLRGDIAQLEEVAAQEEELWLAAERFHGRPVPSSPSEAWLDENMELVEAIPFYRLELRRYRARR